MYFHYFKKHVNFKTCTQKMIKKSLNLDLLPPAMSNYKASFLDNLFFPLKGQNVVGKLQLRAKNM